MDGLHGRRPALRPAGGPRSPRSSPGDPMSPPLDQSACTLASRVRDGDLSPVDLVDLHIRRIESVDPLLNAMTARRFEQARSEARAAAERLAAARRAGEAPPPLLGVPCT
ncbi:MAG: hypothetical protein ACK559_01485, partial [bacterium]